MMPKTVPVYRALTRAPQTLATKRFGWADHFISNLIASRAQPDTGLPTEAVVGR